MSDFLKIVDTSKGVKNNIQKFESLSLKDNQRQKNDRINAKPVIEVEQDDEPTPLLTVVSSRPIAIDDHKPAGLLSSTKSSHQRHDSTAFIQKSYLKEKNTSLTDDAREILKSQPGINDVEAVLSYVQYGIDGRHEFNVKVTSPKATLLVNVLVNYTLPDLWPSFRQDTLSKSEISMKNTLVAALFSPMGIGAVLESIRQYSTKSTSTTTNVETYIEFLADMLHESDTILRLLRDSNTLYEKEISGKLFWQSIVSLFAGSKLLSTTASVNIRETSKSWLMEGKGYSIWLARNIAKAAINTEASDQKSWNNLGQLLRKALMLGYKSDLVANIYQPLLLGKHALWSPLHKLIQSSLLSDQKLLFDCILNDMTRKYSTGPELSSISSTDPNVVKMISGVAALVNGLIMHNEYLLECAVEWVTDFRQGDPRAETRRAMIAALSQHHGALERVLERCLRFFSEKSQIQNMSTSQQEHLAQIILLVIGNLHRNTPELLKEDPIPTLNMRSVSNRLASSVPRTRLLGMVVGVGMSRCVDEPEKVMDFHVEEMETPEVQELLGLLNVSDSVGSLENLEVDTQPQSYTRSSKKRKIATPKTSRIPESTTKIIAIEEVPSSSEDEDDLVPYRKPLHDPDDSEEDPTLIDRSKPKAPIYIVDLIKQLQLPDDKLEIIVLALKTAAELTRRKTGFGTELSDNIHSLVSALINLQVGLSKSEQQQQRLEALVACIVAQPDTIGKYLTTTYFNGDFSLSQRSTILAAIGLGARELAGFSDTGTAAQWKQIDMFPSQRLPSHLQPNPVTGSKKGALKASNPIAMLNNAATHDMIRPLALAAAESQAGAQVLQVNRTSSSTSLRSKERNTRTRKIPQKTNSILTNSIYLPLSSPLTTVLIYVSSNRSSSGSAALILHPSILTLHLQTLTLILHTLGPTGLSPPASFNSIAHETLLLLSALTRHELSFDGVVLPAMLGLLLALIDITVEIGLTAQERLLGDEFGGIVNELVRWVCTLEDNGAPPPQKDADAMSSGGVAWTVLAAGIQVRWMEIGRRFQGRMLGLGEGDF